jgi:hypothetical protein
MKKEPIIITIVLSAALSAAWRLAPTDAPKHITHATLVSTSAAVEPVHCGPRPHTGTLPCYDLEKLIVEQWGDRTGPGSVLSNAWIHKYVCGLSGWQHMNEAVEQALDYYETSRPESFKKIAEDGMAMEHDPRSTSAGRKLLCEQIHQSLRNSYVEPQQQPLSPEAERELERLMATSACLQAGCNSRLLPN